MDTKIFNTILKVVVAAIFVIGLFLTFKTIGNGDPKNIDAEQLGIIEWNSQLEAHENSGSSEPFAPEMSDIEMGTEIANETEHDIVSGISTTINFTLIVLWGCIIIGLITFLFAVVTDFKRFIPFLIGTALLLVVIGISYMISTDVIPADLASKTDAKTYKLVGTGILTSMILTAIAGIGWVAGEALKMIK